MLEKHILRNSALLEDSVHQGRRTEEVLGDVRETEYNKSLMSTSFLVSCTYGPAGALCPTSEVGFQASTTAAMSSPFPVPAFPVP